jgi:pimeloyl-ACP methyl ester carboxylesterase
VAALALLGSTARPDTPEMIRLRSEACELFAQGRMDEVLRANIPFAFHPGHPQLNDLVADYLAMLQRAGAAQLIRQNRAVMARPDYRPLLPTLTCPVLVMCGENDLLTPPDCSREIAAGVAGARLEVLPACGHLLTMEQASALSQSLMSWLDQGLGAPRVA